MESETLSRSTTKVVVNNSAMSFLRGGAPAPAGGINTDKIEMAMTE